VVEQVFQPAPSVMGRVVFVTSCRRRASTGRAKALREGLMRISLGWVFPEERVDWIDFWHEMFMDYGEEAPGENRRWRG
jgi:hypothetical protein